VILD
jgi:hypothetical protein